MFQVFDKIVTLSRSVEREEAAVCLSEWWGISWQRVESSTSTIVQKPIKKRSSWSGPGSFTLTHFRTTGSPQNIIHGGFQTKSCGWVVVLALWWRHPRNNKIPFLSQCWSLCGSFCWDFSCNDFPLLYLMFWTIFLAWGRSKNFHGKVGVWGAGGQGKFLMGRVRF